MYKVLEKMERQKIDFYKKHGIKNLEKEIKNTKKSIDKGYKLLNIFYNDMDMLNIYETVDDINTLIHELDYMLKAKREL